MNIRSAFWCVVTLTLLTASARAAADKPDPASKRDPEPVSNDPQLTTASFGDWVERCQRLNANGEMRRFCEVAETITASGQNAPMAQIAIGRLKKSEPLRLTLVLPVNVSFPSAPRLTIENSDPIDLSWRQCVPTGCFADAIFGGDMQRAWRDAKTANVDSKSAGGQPFKFAISLRGLPQALDALAKEP